MDDPNRGTGRTTAQILNAIAQALLIPNAWVVFRDHGGMSTRHLAEATRHYSKLLGLSLIVGFDDSSVSVKSVKGLSK